MMLSMKEHISAWSARFVHMCECGEYGKYGKYGEGGAGEQGEGDREGRGGRRRVKRGEYDRIW